MKPSHRFTDRLVVLAAAMLLAFVAVQAYSASNNIAESRETSESGYSLPEMADVYDELLQTGDDEGNAFEMGKRLLDMDPGYTGDLALIQEALGLSKDQPQSAAEASEERQLEALKESASEAPVQPAATPAPSLAAAVAVSANLSSTSGQESPVTAADSAPANTAGGNKGIAWEDCPVFYSELLVLETRYKTYIGKDQNSGQMSGFLETPGAGDGFRLVYVKPKAKKGSPKPRASIAVHYYDIVCVRHVDSGFFMKADESGRVFPNGHSCQNDKAAQFRIIDPMKPGSALEISPAGKIVLKNRKLRMYLAVENKWFNPVRYALNVNRYFIREANIMQFQFPEAEGRCAKKEELEAICPTYKGNLCSGHGLCDVRTKSCDCTSGWSGLDCHIETGDTDLSSIHGGALDPMESFEELTHEQRKILAKHDGSFEPIYYSHYNGVQLRYNHEIRRMGTRTYYHDYGDSMTFSRGKGHTRRYEKLLEWQMIPPNHDINEESLVAHLRMDVQALSHDNDITIGVTDGRYFVGFTRADRYNRVIGWPIWGTVGGRTLRNVREGPAGGRLYYTSTAVEVHINLGEFYSVVARSDVQARPVAWAPPHPLDVRRGLKVMVIGDHRGEAYRIFSITSELRREGTFHRFMSGKWLDRYAMHPRQPLKKNYKYGVGLHYKRTAGGKGQKLLTVPILPSKIMSPDKEYTIRLKIFANSGKLRRARKNQDDRAFLNEKLPKAHLWVGVTDGINVVAFERKDYRKSTVGHIVEGSEGDRQAMSGKRTIAGGKSSHLEDRAWLSTKQRNIRRTFTYFDVTVRIGNVTEISGGNEEFKYPATATSTKTLDRNRRLDLVVYSGKAGEEHTIWAIGMNINEGRSRGVLLTPQWIWKHTKFPGARHTYIQKPPKVVKKKDGSEQLKYTKKHKDTSPRLHFKGMGRTDYEVLLEAPIFKENELKFNPKIKGYTIRIRGHIDGGGARGKVPPPAVIGLTDGVNILGMEKWSSQSDARKHNYYKFSPFISKYNYYELEPNAIHFNSVGGGRTRARSYFEVVLLVTPHSATLSMRVDNIYHSSNWNPHSKLKIENGLRLMMVGQEPKESHDFFVADVEIQPVLLGPGIICPNYCNGNGICSTRKICIRDDHYTHCLEPKDKTRAKSFVWLPTCYCFRGYTGYDCGVKKHTHNMAATDLRGLRVESGTQGVGYITHNHGNISLSDITPGMLEDHYLSQLGHSGEAHGKNGTSVEEQVGKTLDAAAESLNKKFTPKRTEDTAEEGLGDESSMPTDE